MDATRTATDLVRDWGKDIREVRRLSDVALGELVRRIATALVDQTKQ